MSENLDIIRKYWECEGNKDLEGILACFQPDATFKAPISDQLQGTEQLRELYAGVITAFADAKVQIQRSTECGDRLAVEWMIPYTTHDGKTGEARGCNVFTVNDGKIQDVKSYFNPAEFDA
jgi:steroid delta-isomerase-like uncharacterized protein